MELLTALARHRHFARAAEASGISQPAFSARIRNLEEGLGVAIVNRGNRFQGFTTEGEMVLAWAHRILQDADGLRQDVSAAMGKLTGRLVLGAVPTALAFAARIPARLRESHPGLLVEIVSATSDDIRLGLRRFSLDAGITYRGDEVETGMQHQPLYDEDYLLVGPASLLPEGGSISWTDAASLPLCLLSQTMQNRRILDQTFATLGVTANVVLETNSFTTALLQLDGGQTATVIPRQMANAIPGGANLRIVELTDPVLSQPIGLMLPERSPQPPAHAALIAAIKSLL